MSCYALVKWTPLSPHPCPLSGPLGAATVTDEHREAGLRNAQASGRAAGGMAHIASAPGRRFSALHGQSGDSDTHTIQIDHHTLMLYFKN